MRLEIELRALDPWAELGHLARVPIHGLSVWLGRPHMWQPLGGLTNYKVAQGFRT